MVMVMFDFKVHSESYVYFDSLLWLTLKQS